MLSLFAFDSLIPLMSYADAHANANINMLGSGSYGLGYNVYNIPEGEYLIGTNGKLNPNATLGRVVEHNGEQFLLTPDNWLENAYRKSTRQEYTESASAGTDRSLHCRSCRCKSYP